MLGRLSLQQCSQLGDILAPALLFPKGPGHRSDLFQVVAEAPGYLLDLLRLVLLGHRRYLFDAPLSELEV